MKSFIITKKKLLMTSACQILAVSLIFMFFQSPVIQTVAKAERLLPIYCVETNEKKIALTFDCAWENSDTLILMDILKSYNIKATFFATGDFCERYPDDVKLISMSGHAVENHSNKHPHVENIEKQKLIDDTNNCDKIIEGITGKKPTLYRAPYGEYSNNMLQVFESDLKHKVIQWDVDSRDWQGREASAMAETVLKKVGNGSIILFHNDTKNTPEALLQIIPKLQSDGYEFVLVEDLILFDNYKLNHEGRQIKSGN